MCVEFPDTELLLFFFTATATTEIYTLSLHDALPIFVTGVGWLIHIYATGYMTHEGGYYRFFSYLNLFIDRKSTRLNSSHQIISYAVFCLKKKRCATARCRRTRTASST